VRVLALVVRYPHDVAYYDDWIEAFATHPQLITRVHDIGAASGKARLPALLKDADLVVALHATTSDWLSDLEAVTPMLLDRRCPLVVFVGNEFNQPFPWLADKIALAKRLRAEIVASQLLQETADWLYAETGALVLSLPHGVNPRRFFAGPAFEARRYDLVSRSFRYPVYVGDRERNDLLSAAAALAQTSARRIDVRIDVRAPPDAWADLLRAARATISTEAGTWQLERDDATARRVAEILKRTGPRGFELSAPVRRALRQLPPGVKGWLRGLSALLPRPYAPLAGAHPAAAAEIAALFAAAPRAPVYGKCVSSRHFDALGAQTLQLLTPGRYNDILVADEHYLAIAPDGADLAAKLEAACDPAVWTRIVSAGADLAQRSTYGHRIDRLLSVLERSDA